MENDILEIERKMIFYPNIYFTGQGAARLSLKEFQHYLYIALGSLVECETQLEIAKRLDYWNEDKIMIDSINEIRRTIQGLIRYLGNKNA